MKLSSDIEYKEEENSYIIFIPKVFDVSNSYKIKDDIININQNKNKDIILDMNKTNFIDSSGIGISIMILKELMKNNKKLYIKNAKGMVKECLEIAKIDKFINLI